MDQDFPQYHLRPEKNWINDPNGMIFHNGEYHVFMQYNPNGPLWGDIHWLYYSSPDLINWTNQGIAIAPGHIYDKMGCWSGCAVENDEGSLVLVYSADNGETRLPAMVRCNEDLTEFEKYEENPIIKQRPFENLHGFRDHKIWKEGQIWHHLIGSGKDDKGIILHYISENFIDWHYRGIWFEVQHVSDYIIECPDYFEIGDIGVLIYSTNDPIKEETLTSFWVLGYKDKTNSSRNSSKFLMENTGIIDYDRMYAPQVMFDGKRHLMIGWIREDRNDDLIENAGWAGALSVPRKLEIEEINSVNLNSDNEVNNTKILKMYPVEELQQLRLNQNEYKTSNESLKGVVSHQSELYCEITGFSNQEKAEANISIGNMVKLDILNDSGKLIINRSTKDKKEIPFEYIPENTLILHIFIDHSIIEIFINYSSCITSRVYGFNDYSELEFTLSSSGEKLVSTYDLMDLNKNTSKINSD